MGEYDLGLVCLNGHGVNPFARSQPAHNAQFCSKCGEPAISNCPKCGAGIRGSYHMDGVWDLRRWRVPSHCHACGAPYPWTQRRSEALAETIDELDDLPEADREKLKKSIPDIIAESPKSETAVLRFKKAAAKLGAAGGKVLMDALSKVAAEAVRGRLGL